MYLFTEESAEIGGYLVNGESSIWMHHTSSTYISPKTLSFVQKKSYYLMFPKSLFTRSKLSTPETTYSDEDFYAGIFHPI